MDNHLYVSGSVTGSFGPHHRADNTDHDSAIPSVALTPSSFAFSLLLGSRYCCARKCSVACHLAARAMQHREISLSFRPKGPRSRLERLSLRRILEAGRQIAADAASIHE